MRHVLHIVGAVGAAAAVIGCGVATAQAASPTPITSGKTVITLDRSTMAAVHGAGLTLTVISPATKVRRDVTLPTESGTATPPNYVEHESGGFSIGNGSATVEFTHITLDTAHHVARARVTGLGHIAALTLGDPQSGSGGPGMVQFGGYTVTLKPAVVRALDTALHTKVFATHSALGTGSSTIRF